jgi:hypothetical protein
MERKRLNADIDAPPVSNRTLLDDELISQFTQFTEEGMAADGVCDLLGIASSTFWSWLRKGERYLVGKGQPEEHEIYGRFVRAFRFATAKYRLKVTRRLNAEEVDKHWTRDMAILERRDRKTWGRNDPMGGEDNQFDPDEKFL